ncbi:hypothetical protein E4665_08945 [Sporolactobacillus shoreae]|uniref:Tubby C-terminal domain-containing protein n=1 Tax=Sporolactobacillus shoreae TaxID=1465501 RepID=A0A4Z0GMU1_9BACL|nr:hypothetical protein [Sporolactobacillus shoreae]TGA98354.1 hypothetical protein E4665_08945 [Sporolactobacillus shoreae]
MITYHYRTRFDFSTRQTTIYNEQDETIGSIQRTYPTKVQQLIDTVLYRSRHYKNYEIRNQERRLIVSITDQTKRFKRRDQKVIYYKNDQVYSFHLIDSTVFGDTENVTFSFENQKCSIQKLPLEPAKFTVNGQLAADWKIPVKSPLNTQVRLLNEDLKKDILLFIGCLHGYYSAEGY